MDDAGGWAGNRNGVLLRGVMVVLAGLRHGKSGRHGRERDGERLWSLRLKNRVRHGGENLEGGRRRRGATERGLGQGDASGMKASVEKTPDRVVVVMGRM